MSNLTHFCCESESIGEYAILTQSPVHARKIAAMIGATTISEGDFFHIYTGDVGAARLSVVSCGMGSPAAALALEELSLCGTTTVLRVGNAQKLACNVDDGDVVIATGGVKMDGTSSEYAVMEFPAVANFEVTRALTQQAQKLLGKDGFCVGIVEGRDVLARRKDFDRTLVSGSCIYEKALRRGGVLCCDMETAALFIVARYLNIRAGSINLIGANDEKLELCNRLALATIEQLSLERADDTCLLS